MSLVFLGLGSNLGNGRANLLEAWQRLGRHEKITTLTMSSPYRSEPVGISSEHWFTNAVGVLETSLAPHDLLEVLLATEQAMGRDRAAGHDRTLDLDLLYYDDMIINQADLEVPHPRLSSRLFVLAPLTEIAPDHVHPVLGLSSRRMLRELTGSEQVEKLNWT